MLKQVYPGVVARPGVVVTKLDGAAASKEIEEKLAQALQKQKELATKVAELEKQKPTTASPSAFTLLDVHDDENENGAMVTIEIGGQPSKVLVTAKYEVVRKLLQKAKASPWGSR